MNHMNHHTAQCSVNYWTVVDKTI